MGIHNLRICDKDYMMWVSIRTLLEVLKCNSIISYVTTFTYPAFPAIPRAISHPLLEHCALTPTESKHPEENKGEAKSSKGLELLKDAGCW